MTAKMYLEQGIQYIMQGNLDHATFAFCQAITLDPLYAPAYNNLGLVLRDTKRFAEAEACFRHAIELCPQDALAYNNLGLVLMDLDYATKAEDCFRQAILLSPQQPQFYNNLGTLLEETFQLTAAQAAYSEAITFNDLYAEAHYNLGGLLRRTKQLPAAELSLRRAIALRPQYDEAKLALALLYFLRGEFEKSWVDYEKSRKKRCEEHELHIPFWRGEELTHCHILLFWEYGFGDTLQFVRYVQQVQAVAAKTSLWVQKPLQRLLQTSNPSLTVYTGDHPPQEHFDFACSLLSLPVLFNTTSKTMLPPSPYILPHCASSSTWHTTLRKATNSTYKVGVVWAGNPKHLDDRSRSIAFTTFAALFSISTVCWVSLQVGPHAKDLQQTSYPIIDCSEELIDFAETAKVIETLDLVITVDSAVAHLAGTLGKETWVLLSYSADWRWQLEREDSPWYPTIRLFRQLQYNDWPEVLQRVTSVLLERL